MGMMIEALDRNNYPVENDVAFFYM
ncbi:hypothetical protein BN182_530002 [Clostridioides difficile E9]|nr:hypothetical protein BN182_530002 [Clostridioides difficile E9]